MEISAKETKLMTNNTSDINTEIRINGQKLQTVTSFKYLSSVTTDALLVLSTFLYAGELFTLTAELQ